MSTHAPAAQPGRQAGFTLIELMIAVAVVALLSSLALPSFMDSIRKSRRGDAFAAASRLQQVQERYRSSRPEYATLETLGREFGTSPRGYYTMTLALDANPALGYTITATAVGSQANDSACAVMKAKVQAGALTYLSGSSDVGDPNRCWAQ